MCTNFKIIQVKYRNSIPLQPKGRKEGSKDGKKEKRKIEMLPRSFWLSDLLKYIL